METENRVLESAKQINWKELSPHNSILIIHHLVLIAVLYALLFLYMWVDTENRLRKLRDGHRAPIPK